MAVNRILILFVSIFVSLVGVSSFAASISARVDRDAIGIDETLFLVVKTDAQSSKSPDFSSLKADFDILSNSQSRNIQIVNGNTESSMEWQITLAPKRLGKLLIPSFNLDNAVSDAIPIEVTKNSNNQTTNTTSPVAVRIETDKDEVFVQQQILLTIKLVTEVNLSQAELQPLEIPNAIVAKLGDSQYQTNSNGKPQLVVETRYAIYAQNSGSLKIPALVYTVLPQTDSWGDPFGRRRAQVMRLHTDEKQIKIKPALDKALSPEWHPASNFTVNEGWSSDPLKAKVGEPLTRTITLMADGLTAGQINPLPTTSVEGLSIYPDQPQTKETKNSKSIQGVRTESFALVPNKAGKLTLPAIKIHWWDTAQNQLRVAELPEKEIVVAASASQALDKVEAPAHQNNLTPKEVPANSPAQPSTSNTTLLFIAALALGSLLLNAYLGWLLYRKTKLKEQELTTRLEEPTTSERQIWNRLKQAVKENDFRDLKAALLAWAQHTWPLASIHTVYDITEQANNEQLRELLLKLEAQLYGSVKSGEELFDSLALLEILNQIRKEMKHTAINEELPPLYANRPKMD